MGSKIETWQFFALPFLVVCGACSPFVLVVAARNVYNLLRRAVEAVCSVDEVLNLRSENRQLKELLGESALKK